jgi:hypothetical protein
MPQVLLAFRKGQQDDRFSQIGPALINVQASMPGQSFLTSRGPAFVTGNLGTMQTTTIPGSGGEGFLMNNGNGTSTLLTPGGLPQTVATPR